MEALEEPPISNAPEEGVKVSTSDEVTMNAEASVEMELNSCHTSNGIAELDCVELKNEQDIEEVVETTVADDEELAAKFEEDYDSVNEAMETEISSAEVDNPEYGNEDVETEIVTVIQEAESSEVENDDGTIVIETEVVEESVVELDGIVDNSAGNITFETEIFIENHDELEEETVTCDEPDSSNILGELGQNIELSDVLRSSDVNETVENNNCEQEVFNKKELLDILEGNDVEQSRKMISENFHTDSKKLEEHLALQQLNRLKCNASRKKNRHSPKKPEKKQPKRSSSHHVPKETKGKVDDTASTKMSPKEAKGKADESTSTKMSPKEAKGKGDDTPSSKMSPKEAKGKLEGTVSSKTTLKEAKTKIEDATSSKIAPKEARGKSNDTGTSNNSSKELKGKLGEKSSSSHIPKEANKVDEAISSINTPQEAKEQEDETTTSTNASKEAKGNDKSILQNVPRVAKIKIDEKPKTESIVKALVQDWSDDENMEPDESNTLIEESEVLLESTNELAKLQESDIQEVSIQNECHENDSTANNADASVSEETTPNRKSSDETQPQRRLGRVIKKKVIYDPDNPDTFTKTKVQIKKEKDALPEKEQSVQSTPKKMKTEQSQTPKTKSPVSKMQWKKPQPKSTKQSSRRLTEIDRLLMDEGAVNMICQLTPEAPKGNKNMKSRAEFIKNIQSNTPDTKEMKFRERKNKLRSDGDPKKLGIDKHKLSLSSTVKSPSVSEDFENHSADDSIIYRRHSSSSYSSSCMSPRRLSDVEGVASQVAHRESQDVSIVGTIRHSDVFMEDKSSTPRRDMMNKSDCLSIKEKLNSKLSQALNKRKLPGFKSEKPCKVKKVIPVEEVSVNSNVTVNFNQNVAEICIHKTGSLFSIQVTYILYCTDGSVI